MLEIGSIVDGKYKILNKVGQGGMSVVYLAMNERANKQWAIKEVRKDGVQDYEVVKQGLIVETGLLKKLQHDNLPSIVDVIDNDETFLIVMDYIEGNPLSKTLKEYGAQPQEDVIKWAKQLCNVLGYLHAQNPPIIYRDMKPANVMLRPDGKVMLIDFGTAREFKNNRVEDTTCLGTRGYAAPEQYGGRGQTDARTDIYCLGATMYHLVTGHNPSEPPFQIYPIREWNPSLSSGLEEIIWKCTRDNPDERYQSCAELAYALEHCNELDIEYRRKQNRRWAGFLAAFSVTVAAAAGSVGFRSAEEATRKNSYDQYLLEAKSGMDEEEQEELYKNAINLRPTSEEAYIGLLENVYLKDQMFSSKESNKLKAILLDTSDGRKITNEECLRSSRSGYEAFAYKLAMDYYYRFEESEHKNGALRWLDVVVNAETLSKEKVERGIRLKEICEYYSEIGVYDAAGDPTISYRQYWDDLVKLTEGNLTEMDQEKTALVMYKELVNQIANKCARFLEAGVTKQEMEEQLDNVETRLETDIRIDSSDVNYEMLREDKENIQNNIRTARDMLKAGGQAPDRVQKGGE